MANVARDRARNIEVARAIIDGRDLKADMAAILVTLDGVVALVLLAVMDDCPSRAAAMLNEGLVQGVESRLALASARRREGDGHARS